MSLDKVYGSKLEENTCSDLVPCFVNKRVIIFFSKT